MNETVQPAVAGPVEPTVRPARWWRCDTHGPGVATAWGCPECVRELRTERDGLMQTLRDEMDENLRLRELGGALPDETITAMTERLIRELEAHRLYARALCKAVDAATDFAGTVAAALRGGMKYGQTTRRRLTAPASASRWLAGLTQR